MATGLQGSRALHCNHSTPLCPGQPCLSPRAAGQRASLYLSAHLPSTLVLTSSILLNLHRSPSLHPLAANTSHLLAGPVCIMASSAPATPDTLVTLKVNFQGSTRRFKLPLRDLGVNVFEDKVRHEWS